MGLKPGQHPIVQNVPRLAEIGVGLGPEQAASVLLQDPIFEIESVPIVTENARRLGLGFEIQGVTGAPHLAFNLEVAGVCSCFHLLSAGEFERIRSPGAKAHLFNLAFPITRVRLVFKGKRNEALHIARLTAWIQS